MIEVKTVDPIENSWDKLATSPIYRITVVQYRETNGIITFTAFNARLCSNVSALFQSLQPFLGFGPQLTQCPKIVSVGLSPFLDNALGRLHPLNDRVAVETFRLF